jgi:lysophospholipase L1-like esterase
MQFKFLKNCVVIAACIYIAACSKTAPTIMQPITYVPIGDSYTEGTGVNPTDAWPVLLTKQLQADGIDITLVKNIAKSGWKTADAIQGQLPEFKTLQPNFATLFLGANDLFQGVPVKEFAKNYETLIIGMLTVLPSNNNLMLITIPDYSYTPTGIAYARGQSISIGLKEYNDVIYSLAKQYNLQVADVHSTSKKFIFSVSLVSADGLHPSRKGHELWTSVIYPVVKKQIKE